MSNSVSQPCDPESNNIARDVLQYRHAALVTYLRVKLDQADWHGVSDAANDLRVLEEQMKYV